MEIIIRAYAPETDDGYIYSTWTKYAWYSPENPIKAKKNQFFKLKSREIKELLGKALVRIACIKDNPYVIMGYIVINDGKKVWMCVKKDYHNQGIETLLMKGIKDDIETRE